MTQQQTTGKPPDRERHGLGPGVVGFVTTSENGDEEYWEPATVRIVTDADHPGWVRRDQADALIDETGELDQAARWADRARAAAETMEQATSHLDADDLGPEESGAIVQGYASLACAYATLASARLVQSASDALAAIADELCTIARDLRRVDARRAS